MLDSQKKGALDGQRVSRIRHRTVTLNVGSTRAICSIVVKGVGRLSPLPVWQLEELREVLNVVLAPGNVENEGMADEAER